MMAKDWMRVEFRPLGHLHRPRLTRYRMARPRRFAFAFNRYPFSVIGAGMAVGSHGYSLTWGTPARYERRTP